jgi:large subunit ribosomal protein L31
MKKDIHPQSHPVVFVDASTGTEFPAKSSLTSDQTKNIDGVEHYIIKVDISSASHPFFTGEEKLVDAAGRVEKFKAKYAMK